MNSNDKVELKAYLVEDLSLKLTENFNLRVSLSNFLSLKSRFENGKCGNNALNNPKHLYL